MTSEEKLLKLIRQKNPLWPRDPRKGGAKGKLPSQGKHAADQKGFDALLFFNKFLILLCLAVVGYLGFKYSYLFQDKTAHQGRKAKVPVEKKEAERMDWPETKPFDYFQSKLGQRNLFFNPWEKQSQPNQLVQEGSDDWTKQLRLVGIVLDADPKAIIEDINSNQTLFLSKGDSVNNAVLKEILEDKVILMYNNQEVELGINVSQ